MWNAGDRVTWRFYTRNGYGYPVHAAGIVRHITPTGRVRIEVAVRSPRGPWHRVNRTVHPDKLQRRTNVCPELGEA